MKQLLISAGATLAALSLGIAQAQTGVWMAPTLGYVFDTEAKSLRPISGIPGASTIEDGLAVASKLQTASASPNRRHAIGAIHGGGLIYLRLGGKEAAVTELEGGLEGAELIAWSPASDSVAVYGNSRLQIWTALDTVPSLTRQFDVPALTALAVSDHGASVAGVSEAGVLVWASDGAEPYLHAGSHRALTFAPDGSLISATGDSVLILRAGSEPEVLASEGIANANGLALSGDGHKLLVSNQDSESLIQIDLDTRATSAIECGCRAAAPSRLQGNNVFRLTGIAEDRVLIFDGDSAEPRILAIPFSGGRQ